jgi:peptide chain release factor 3
MKAKKLKQALQELAEEGVVQLFRPVDGSPALVGFVGALQLDVLKGRLDQEYGLDVGFEASQYQLARWVGGDKADVAEFVAANRSALADDVDGDPVLLSTSAYALNYLRDKWSRIRFTDVKEVQARAAA